MPGAPNEPKVRFAAVGDILLVSDPTGAGRQRDPAEALAVIRGELADCDVVLGNLECTLPAAAGMVATEPRVIATPESVRAALSGLFGVVTLANNHMFDCFQEGFHRLRRLLDELGVAWFGAGDDLRQAEAPAVMEIGGLRLGFLGAADRRSGTRPFAGAARWGVAPLDAAGLARRVGELRRQVDHVIVSVHWGEERFAIPSPDQVADARAMVAAGASLVIGHHPHVVQGMERAGDGYVAYSLGNFLASEVYYANGDVITWNRTERTGCLLLADLTPAGVENVRQVPTYDDGRRVQVDRGRPGARRIARVNRALARGVTLRRYRREHLRVKTIRPALAHLRWSRLKTLRPRKVRNALASLLHSRGAK